ncbi:MAG: hypothetical protein PVI09_21125, partial [Anaerolineae bacterium]
RLGLDVTDVLRNGGDTFPLYQWHHHAISYDVATHTLIQYEDGSRNRQMIDGDGDYVGDAADDLLFGGTGSGNWFRGRIAWLRLSSGDIFNGASTYDVPLRWPRPTPTADTIEQWNFTEGQGDTVASQVQPWAIRLNGTSSLINYGSNSSLDDIPDGGEITVEAWVRIDEETGENQTILSKGGWTTTGGWALIYHNAGRFRFGARTGTGYALGVSPAVTVELGQWYHVTGYYNDTSKEAYCAVDGVWGDANTGEAQAYASDASLACVSGRLAYTADWWLKGAIGWIRISDNDRHNAGTDFDGSVPSRYAPPAADGNTVEQWANNDASGTTAAYTVNSNNDGSITDGTWTPTGGLNDGTITDGQWGTG